MMKCAENRENNTQQIRNIERDTNGERVKKKGKKKDRKRKRNITGKQNSEEEKMKENTDKEKWKATTKRGEIPRTDKAETRTKGKERMKEKQKNEEADH